MMMSECGFQGSDPVWLLGTLLAALCHDIDHPGVSNTVLTSALSDLSVLYNDMSVLENHHTAVTWEVSARVRLCVCVC